MTRPLRISYPGAFYHVTSRGNEKKAVFKSIRDREKFFEYFESANKRYDAVIHAYCLMHYHSVSGLENCQLNFQHIIVLRIFLFFSISSEAFWQYSRPDTFQLTHCTYSHIIQILILNENMKG